MPFAMKLALDPAVQKRFISVAHLREGQSGLAFVACPDDLSFTHQRTLLARQREFDLHDLVSNQWSDALKSNSGLADVEGLRGECPLR